MLSWLSQSFTTLYANTVVYNRRHIPPKPCWGHSAVLSAIELKCTTEKTNLRWHIYQHNWMPLCYAEYFNTCKRNTTCQISNGYTNAIAPAINPMLFCVITALHTFSIDVVSTLFHKSCTVLVTIDLNPYWTPRCIRQLLGGCHNFLCQMLLLYAVVMNLYLL